MPNLKELYKKINTRSPILFNEPMSDHTSFKIGGPADVFAQPSDTNELAALFKMTRDNHVPCFVLGGGSNILVADNGIEGIVMDLGQLSGIEVTDTTISARSGSLISEVSEAALSHSLTGMEFIYSMPGSVGGAIWMNARCYGVSVSEVLESVEYIGEDCKVHRMKIKGKDFEYKRSPFQTMNAIIVEGKFSLREGETDRIRAEMDSKKHDRVQKGHFLAPSAGSVFKNNRDFGKSTGEIIDSLGLKGYSIGKARISPLHANIIVNEGNASARNVYEIIHHIEKSVRDKFGFELEREVILVGRWPRMSPS